MSDITGSTEVVHENKAKGCQKNGGNLKGEYIGRVCDNNNPSEPHASDASGSCSLANDSGIDAVAENHTMKLISDEMTVSRIDAGVMSHTCCNLLSNDMSISLPNLAVNGMWTGSGINDGSGDVRLTRSSIDYKGSLSEINDKLKHKTLSLEDCQSGSKTDEKSASEPNTNSNGSTEDLPISLNSNHNRLSAVLENISLVYLPQTKQLVSVKSGSTGPSDAVLTTADNNNKYTLPERECPEGAESSMSTNIGTKVTTPVADVAEVSDRPIPSLEHIGLSDSSNDFPIESGNSSVILSQDSDVSAQSHSTVINCHESFDASHTSQDILLPQDNQNLCADNEPSKLSTDNGDSPNSLSRTDASSFSSISSLSTGTELSVSAASYSDSETPEKPIVDTDEAGFVDISLDSKSLCDQNLVSRNSSQDSGIGEGHQPCHTNQTLAQGGAKPKKKGLSFLTRSIFSRKTKESPTDPSPLGWRLFGKVPPKVPTDGKDVPVLTEAMVNVCAERSDIQARYAKSATRVKKTDVEAPSTTALILENRPHGLPSKDPEEELRHRQQYEAMVEAAKKKELREAKQRKKQLQQQLKHEDALSAAVKIWNTEILSNWENMRLSKKARDLWWHGIPPSVRGRVWKLAFGNDLNLTSELYEICMSRAKDRLKIMREAGSDTDSVSSFSMFADLPSSKEASVELIKLDVSRTFPQLCIFQKRGPYHELLQGLLGAYACYRPDVGYVQGMSFIAAVLLLNMDVDDAFICFANLLNRPCQIAFFRLDENLMNSYFETYEEFFEENLPRLFSFFKKQNLTSNLYIIDWLFTLYAKSLPLDVASRVWDVFCRDGEEFLFRTALGILKMHEEILLDMDFIHLAQFLTRLPDNISSDKLFSCIEMIHMNIDKRKFCQILTDKQEQNKSSTDS